MADIENMVANSAQAIDNATNYAVNSGWYGSTDRLYSGQINNILNELSSVRDYNNNWSAEQAAIQRNWSSEQAELTRLFNAAEASKNRQWQEYMSNTAHQREVKDLLAAGLNPVLSALGGNGAAVTSGAVASSTNPSGSSANGDQSTGMAMASILGTILSNQERMSETLINAQLTREENEKARALNEMLTKLSVEAGLSNTKTSAQAQMYSAAQSAYASMYGHDLNYDYNIRNLNWQERSDMAWRILERDKTDVSRLSQSAQQDYYQGLLESYGYDRDSAEKIAGLYTDTTKHEGDYNRGSSFIETLLTTLSSFGGSVMRMASH